MCDKVIDSVANENMIEDSEANEQTVGQKCISLRFENYRTCEAVVAANSRFCQHHHEIHEYLCEGMNFRNRFHLKEITIESKDDEDAVLEVEKYMLHFMYSILVPDSTMNYWWMREQVYVPRKIGTCTSLRLEDGLLCAVELDRHRSRCEYHHLQHDILCTEYHPSWRPMNRHISSNTECFIEFVLRKEFAHLFGYNQPYCRELNHRMRFGYLYPMMFEYPFPKEHVVDIDTAVIAELELMVGVIKRSDKVYVRYQYDDESDEDSYDSENVTDAIEESSSNSQPIEEEDWD